MLLKCTILLNGKGLINIYLFITMYRHTWYELGAKGRCGYQTAVKRTQFGICVTVLGHSLLSHPVAWRRWSSPIGLGYRRYASTHLLNALQMAVPRAAI